MFSSNSSDSSFSFDSQPLSKQVEAINAYGDMLRASTEDGTVHAYINLLLATVSAFELNREADYAAKNTTLATQLINTSKKYQQYYESSLKNTVLGNIASALNIELQNYSQAAEQMIAVIAEELADDLKAGYDTDMDNMVDTLIKQHADRRLQNALYDLEADCFDTMLNEANSDGYLLDIEEDIETERFLRDLEAELNANQQIEELNALYTPAAEYTDTSFSQSISQQWEDSAQFVDDINLTVDDSTSDDEYTAVSMEEDSDYDYSSLIEDNSMDRSTVGCWSDYSSMEYTENPMYQSPSLSETRSLSASPSSFFFRRNSVASSPVASECDFESSYITL